MPNLTGITALDVAIGLTFVYLLFSLLCTVVVEGIPRSSTSARGRSRRVCATSSTTTAPPVSMVLRARSSRRPGNRRPPDRSSSAARAR